jgi:hypothetical protein
MLAARLTSLDDAIRRQPLAHTPAPTDIPPRVSPISNEGTTLRSGPSTSTTRLGNLPFGETAPIIGKKTCGEYVWWEISYNGLTAWVRSDVVTEQGNTENVADNITVECPPQLLSCQLPPLSAWALDKHSSFGAGIVSSNETCISRSALRVSAKFQGNNVPEQAAVAASMPNGVNWTACSTITASVYVPPEFQFARARLAIKTGPDYTWFQQASLPYVEPGQWTTVVATLRDIVSVESSGLTPDLSDVRGVDVVFFNDQSPLTPDQNLCVSNVSVH